MASIQVIVFNVPKPLIAGLAALYYGQGIDALQLPADAVTPSSIQVVAFEQPQARVYRGLYQSQDTEVPVVADEPETNTHQVGRFSTPVAKLVRGLWQNTANDDSGPLPEQPPVETHTVGSFKPPKLNLLPLLRQQDVSDVPIVLVDETNVHGPAKFSPARTNTLALLRQNTADDFSGPLPLQPQTNTHTLARFSPSRVRLDRGLIQNSDSEVVVIEPPFTVPPSSIQVVAFEQPQAKVLRLLYAGRAFDESQPAPPPEEAANPHFLGRFSKPRITLYRELWQNQSNHDSAGLGAPIVVELFAPSKIRLLHLLWQNVANDVTAALPQVGVETYRIGTFKVGRPKLLRSLWQNESTDHVNDTVEQVVGKFRAVQVNYLPLLRQNIAADDSVGQPEQPSTLAQSIARFGAPKTGVLPALRQNVAADDSGPLPEQPQTEPPTLAQFKPATVELLRELIQTPAQDESAPLPPQPATEVSFLGRFKAATHLVYRGLLQNEALDERPPPVPSEEEPLVYRGHRTEKARRALAEQQALDKALDVDVVEKQWELLELRKRKPAPLTEKPAAQPPEPSKELEFTDDELLLALNILMEWDD